MGPSGRQTARKIQLRLMWPLALLLLLNSLDRVNISFGALQMNREIGLDARAYGLGVSIFFMGYFIFQAPSVWALKRWGARRWLFAVVGAWGTAAAAMALIRSPTDFYIVRALLGFAEAGFAPGVIYLAATWMPVRYRATAIATVMLAVPISVIVGGPICAWLMSQANPLGISGWRWMSLLEGLLTVAMAFVCLRIFVDDPKDATWLSAPAKDWLSAELQSEDAVSTAPQDRSLSKLVRDPRVWLAAATWFGLLGGLYGVIFWLPQIIKQLAGGSTLAISLIAAAPWVASLVGSLLNAWHSDRSQERFLHCSLALFLAAIGLALAASTSHLMLALAGLTLSGLGLGGAQGTFWTIPPKFLGRTSATTGVALINMMGNTSGVIVPLVIGAVRDRTGSFVASVYVIAGLLAFAGLITQFIKAGVPACSANRT
jgi:ACS family tartrate transporter-like MFS transporter